MRFRLTTKIVIAIGAMAAMLCVLLVSHTGNSNRELSRFEQYQRELIMNALTEVQRLRLSIETADREAFRSALQNLASRRGINAIWITDANREIISSSVNADETEALASLSASIETGPIYSSYSSAPIVLERPGANQGNQIGLATVCDSAIYSGQFACDIAFVDSDLSSEFSDLRMQLFNQLLFLLMSTLCLTVLLYHIIARGFSDPIGTLDKLITEFKSGNQEARGELKGVPELRLLTRSLNRLFNKIEANERHLTQKQQLFESLIDTMADGLITVQSDGTIESMNRAAELLLGFRHKELVGSNISLIFADSAAEDPEQFLNGFIGSSQSGNPPVHWEVEMRSREDKLVPIRLSVSKMNLDDDVLFIGVLSDMTDIKEMEAKLLALNEKLSKSNARLEQTVITDSLTGLYNRRHFDDTLKKELARSTRQQSTLSLLVVDIDFFKQYNDRYGHAKGDDCLRQVSDCIKSVFKRGGDLPARYGGEEFAIILPNCDALELQERAETLRTAIVGLALPHADAKDESIVTVSAGAVTYKPVNAEVVAPKPKDLFSEADKALYLAKGRGRNNVVFAGLYQPMPVAPSTGHLYGHFITR